MAHGKSDTEIIQNTHNTSRFFVENRHISWVLLVGTILWGIYGYVMMPKRKDPEVPVGMAVAVCVWPGAGSEKIEQLVTRRLEERVSENSKVEKIESISRANLSILYVKLDERVKDIARELDDIELKLASIRDLPDGAGPIQFLKDFSQTTSLMLTVASPKADGLEISQRASVVRTAIDAARTKAAKGKPTPRVTGVICHPNSLPSGSVARQLNLLSKYLSKENYVRDLRAISGMGFVGFDGVTDLDEIALRGKIQEFVREKLHVSELHPDLWGMALIRNPEETAAKLAAVAGDRYSYRELDDFTDLIRRTLQTLPQVSKISRSGILNERIFLDYSQERMAGYGVAPSSLIDILRARNTLVPGGVIEVPGRNMNIRVGGEFTSEREIGDVLVTASATGSPVYLRDAIEIIREYESPPRFLNFFTSRDEKGNWQRTRAVTLGIHMRPGEQIGNFGDAVEKALVGLKSRLPKDLVMARTSDQPLQVRENVDLFMTSLYEAIVLVVLVAFVGFREWRSAALMATSIPLTLAMTYGMMHLLGIDLQQVSIASLILALGLLVDDPVVAGDAIKRELSAGHPPLVASWLGPTKLGRAILFATITNIVAYLPLLMISGGVGQFISSLPIVLACSLVASRLVSMTFIPLLGYYLLRLGKRPDLPLEERRKRGFPGFYYRVGSMALEHRWRVLVGSLLFLALGAFLIVNIRPQFFPKDLSYLSYIDIWLPEDAPLSETNQTAIRAEQVVREVVSDFAKSHGDKLGESKEVLRSLTTFVGGGGPRFWFSVSPELPQLNYSQIILQVNDKHLTGELVAPLQQALAAKVPGARVDMRQLETTEPVPMPVMIRISGENTQYLQTLAEEVKGIFRKIPIADGIRDDWGTKGMIVNLQINPDRANLAGVSNADIAASSVTAMSGYQVSALREGDKQIPILARLRIEERSQVSDIKNLYVYSLRGPHNVPLGQVSSIDYKMEIEKTRRYNQFRTITVSCLPVPGALPFEVLKPALPSLNEFQKKLPPGYKMEIGGEQEGQVKGFGDMAIAMVVSIACIYLALVIQFRHAIKPLLVFSAIPYGMVGALGALAIMGAPFGFMAFLGIASLTGVIISHVIVLFDFVEEMHEQGKPLRDALLDAGIIRLRPVAVTVGATIFGLVPLAMHGGPLWEPLCYAQIGGLAVANFITKLLVPALYAIFVLDLKIVRWETREH